MPSPIYMFEHKNPILYELAMKFFIQSHALVCAFLICLIYMLMTSQFRHGYIQRKTMILMTRSLL